MTHPCFTEPATTDVTALVDALTAKTGRTPEEECCMHALREQADTIDRLVALNEQQSRQAERTKTVTAEQRRQQEQAWQIERAETGARITSLRHINADLRDRLIERIKTS